MLMSAYLCFVAKFQVRDFTKEFGVVWRCSRNFAFEDACTCLDLRVVQLPRISVRNCMRMHDFECKGIFVIFPVQKLV